MSEPFDLEAEAARIADEYESQETPEPRHVHGNVAHITIEIQVGVSYCPGTHPGEDAMHDELVAGCEFFFVPPADVGGWPIEDELREKMALTLLSGALIERFGGIVQDMPGAVPVAPHHHEEKP